jgi:hypothetical protein
MVRRLKILFIPFPLAVADAATGKRKQPNPPNTREDKGKLKSAD